MTDTVATLGRGSRRRRWLFAVSLLVAVVAGAWITRVALWPCGALDRSSGCVSSVRLDVAGLGLDPGKTTVEYPGLDLGPDAGVVLVALKSPTDSGLRVVLAVFDARTGQLIRTLVDAMGDDPRPFLDDIALSSDAGLVAAVVGSRGKTSEALYLQVYRVADGSLVRTVWTLPGDQNGTCVGLLDFSPDGRKLQCNSRAYDLDTGAVESLVDEAGNFRYPVFVSKTGYAAQAPDGTRAGPYDLGAALDLIGSVQKVAFAPDSRGLLSLQRVRRENQGQPSYAPSVFRRRSAVAVWDGQTLEIQRAFFANQRYLWIAWSQDATMFGLLTDDLRLDVFPR